MVFYTPQKEQKFEKLTGSNPTKLYVPLNSGRRVGQRNTTGNGGFINGKPADQVELGSWFSGRINDGTYSIDTDHKAWFDANVSQGEYADDAAADSGSVLVGQIYYNTTNSAYQTRMV